MGTRKQLVPKDIDIRPVRENELVYLQSSPDFCTKNDKQGSIGTQDRWDAHVEEEEGHGVDSQEMTDPACLLTQDVDFSEVASCSVVVFSLQAFW